MRKILFIGPIGKLDHPQGGDQYKNQLLLEALTNIDSNVVFIDTTNWNRKIKNLLKLLKAVFFEEFDILRRVPIEVGDTLMILVRERKERSSYIFNHK